MSSILQRYATPLTIGLFLVSLISGVALFFHAAPGVFHSMHEWLSMLLIAPVVLHLWRNWRPMMSYLARPAFAISMSVCLVAAMGFGLASTVVGGRHGSAQFAILEALTATTPEKLAPALGTDAEHLVEMLKLHGFAKAAADVTLTELVADSGRDEGDLASALAAAVVP